MKHLKKFEEIEQINDYIDPISNAKSLAKSSYTNSGEILDDAIEYVGGKSEWDKLSEKDKNEVLDFLENSFLNENIEYSNTFTKHFIKDNEQIITIFDSSDIDNAIKSGNKIKFENYLIIPNLDRITCLIVRDAPRSKMGYKTIQHYRYKTIEDMINRTSAFVDSILKYRKEKDEYKQEKKQKHKEGLNNIKNIIKVGDILYNSWGYDQTNVDFYQIVKVLDASVIIRQISSEQVPNSGGFMSSYVRPIPNSFVGEEIRKNVNFYGNKYYLSSKFGQISKYESGDEGVYNSWYA